MLEFVHAENIDDRILARAQKVLEDGGLLAWPSDSSWCITCSLSSKKGLEALKKLKGGTEFTPTVVCAELRQFDELTIFDTDHFRMVKGYVPGPFVFILQARHAVHRHMAMKRAEIGMRIPDHPVAKALLRYLGTPLFSITASRCMTEGGWWSQEFAEENLFEYGAELEDIPGLDMILDAGEYLPRQLTTVVSLLDKNPTVLRQGIGEY